jgi:hypothetical protein
MSDMTTDDAGRAGMSRVDSMDVPEDGWVLFAGLMILFTGLWTAFEGLLGFFWSAYFIGGPVLGSLWMWALLWMVFGLVGIGAGAAIMSGQSWGRWFGIVVVSLNGLIHVASIVTYPWWSLVIIAVDLLILYALTVRWRRAVAT